MRLQQLDHITMHTTDSGRLAKFYENILGFTVGDRPAFANSTGAWLYLDGHPLVHLINEPKAKRAEKPQIEHFAFRAEGLADFLAKLRTNKVAYDCRVIPGRNIRQVHIHDSDGNHIEVAFQPHEEANLTNYAGD